jgi:hypothetical protein
MLGMEPDPWQAEFLNSEAPRILMNCSRQSGKSTVSAIRALHEALIKPGALVLILAPAERQAQELFSKVSAFYRQLGHAPTPDSDRKSGMTLANGSRIEALPGSSDRTIRGYSGVDLLLLDEASRVVDELYFAIRPMLAVSGGGLLMLSSPAGKRGIFYEAWVGDGPWERYEITAYNCPRITEEFLEEERRSLPARVFRQEYLCNPPEAPIWMGDFSFQQLGDVRVGDTVIGWSQPARKAANRYLIRAEVTAVGRREAEIVEVRLASGNVLYCTPDHRWLNSLNGSGESFRPARVGEDLVRVINPTKPLPPELLRDAAWLGGIYDGEGTGDTIAQSVTHNPEIHARIASVLEALGLHGAVHADGFYIRAANGGRERKQALVDFLNWTRPTKRDRFMDRRILSSKFCHPDEVVEIRPAGRSEVVSLQTTSGNYIVWGYASKNCSFEEAEGQVFSEKAIQESISEEVAPMYFDFEAAMGLAS